MTFDKFKYEEAKKRRLWNANLWQKVQNETICSVLLPFIEKGKITIDVGGNSGYQTVWHAQYNNVITYEAVPDLCHILESNLRMRGLNAVEIRNKAVGDRNENVDFYVDANRMSMSSQIPLVGNVKKIVVPMVKLDDDINYDYEKIGFIKIDVEGYEMSVLRGADKLVEAARPTMMVEIYKPWCDKTNIPIADHFQWFDDRDYKSYYYSNKEKRLMVVDSVDHGVHCVETKHAEHDGDFLFVGK